MSFFSASDLTKESDKAATILKSFLDKKKIPQEAITNARGLAIFTAFRAGMYLAGSGGSGVVIARLPDGTWSSPSAFSVRSGSFGLVWGVDMYDCVCVLNTEAAVSSYKKSEVNLGGAIGVAAGPIGGNLGATKDVKPIWTYTKSRGLYGGVTIDGTVIKERKSANEKFYGEGVTAEGILGGQTKAGEAGRKLTEVVKAAEGKAVDEEVLQQIGDEQTPGDLVK